MLPYLLFTMLTAALSNGDEAEVDMKIGTESYSDDVSCGADLYV